MLLDLVSVPLLMSPAGEMGVLFVFWCCDVMLVCSKKGFEISTILEGRDLCHSTKQWSADCVSS